MVDWLLSSCLLLLLAIPMALAFLFGRLRREVRQGRNGQSFELLQLDLPDQVAGRFLARLGATHWPILFNIWRGDLAWVGPRARSVDEASVPEVGQGLRPGLVNPWFLRRRTAVDFGDERDADLLYLHRRGVRHDLGLLARGAVVALLPPPVPVVPGRVQVGDVAFDNVSMGEAVARLRDLLDGDQPAQVSFVNPACVNIAASDRGYRRVLSRAALVLPDGIGIKIGGDLLGTPLKQNVNGTDLFPRLCEMLQARGASLFLLGGQPGVPEAVAAEIGRRWPDLRIAGLRDGYFTAAEEGDVAAQICGSGADMLLVARGVPAQDLFVDRYLPLLGVKVAMGVGGLFDFVSGRMTRAPLWMRETGLEWAYRLSREPGRMWRRYLVGNLTFLARMVLQRLGLRRPAADALPAARPSQAAAPGSGVRAIIFATGTAGQEFPVAPDMPVGLLPLGHQSVIERIMEQLNLAAITDVHIVVSDQPEALRQRLRDGSRWGLKLEWHLANDPLQPYSALYRLLARGARRVVVGHADYFLHAAALVRLAETEQLLMAAEPGASDQAESLVTDPVVWSGWASLSTAHLGRLMTDMPAEEDRQQLLAAMQALALPSTVAEPADGVWLTRPQSYLAAQFHGASDEREPIAPPSWIRRSWGAMSPKALVADGAVVAGPVLVGPGCVVERGAIIGPNVVLSRHVVVSSGTHISNSVVMPNSYVGMNLDLNDTLVNGPRVWHVRLEVEASPAATDAVLMSLAEGQSSGPSLMGRVVAALVLVLVLPWLWLHRRWRRLRGQPAEWRVRSVVAGRDEVTQQLRMAPVRCPQHPDRWGSRVWAFLAGLIDVAAGQRAWFGMRLRSRDEWMALRPEWQGVLAQANLGLLHAPAWSHEPSAFEEAQAVADVFCAVLPPRRQGWHVLGAWWRMPIF